MGGLEVKCLVFSSVHQQDVQRSTFCISIHDWILASSIWAVVALQWTSQERECKVASAKTRLPIRVQVRMAFVATKQNQQNVRLALIIIALQLLVEPMGIALP